MYIQKKCYQGKLKTTPISQRKFYRMINLIRSRIVCSESFLADVLRRYYLNIALSYCFNWLDIDQIRFGSSITENHKTVTEYGLSCADTAEHLCR
jgi:hypothetical protein